MKYLYLFWMLAGVVGFPASFGWLLHRWQQAGRAASVPEKARLQEHVKKAGLVCVVFLLILLSFLVFTAVFFTEKGAVLP